MTGINRIYYLLIVFILAGCSKSEAPAPSPDGPDNPTTNTAVKLSTDKALYHPGDVIQFTSDKTLTSSAKIRYRYLNEVIKEEDFPGKTWQWTAPDTDFTGYMVDVYETVNGKEEVYGSIGVDVSSDWTHFPRYGFLSEFSGDVTADDINSQLAKLTRYHINGLQYYDWQNKHHMPLKMDGSQPAAEWQDIAKRDVSFDVVKGYIDKAHEYGIASMFYNLLYGAWDDYATDGVSAQWMLYNDANHQNVNKHDLDNNWALSDIFVLDPANPDWQKYIDDQTALVYQFLDFDGWHLDQLGDRGTVYDYNGQKADLPYGFSSFLNNLNQRFPNKKMVMNAVNQYGQDNILSTPVNFAYTEVWSPNDTYEDLASIIQDNTTMGGTRTKTVLAAYMDYDKANSTGYFNTPGVLMTDAVIFAFGGSHLELGEHMLGKEYFPNDNLLMRTDLKEALTRYYDFQVAYENLLQGNGDFNTPSVTSLDGQININSWPPQTGSVTVTGKDLGSTQIINLLNYMDATSLNWRDASGTQPFQRVIKDLSLQIETTKTVKKVWYASPDYRYGSSEELAFMQDGSTLTCTIPEMQYWGMLVIEYN